jgi:hypothetical protein
VSGSDTQAYKFRQFLLSLPGKRGLDIPEDTFDKIHQVASGITQPLWGRPPTPQQMQHLFDTGAHDPQAIHDAFAGLDHPHAAGLKVGEYEQWKGAHQAFKAHGGGG